MFYGHQRNLNVTSFDLGQIGESQDAIFSMHTDYFKASICGLVLDVVTGSSNQNLAGRKGRLRLVAHKMQSEGLEREEIGRLRELHSSYLCKMSWGVAGIE